MGLAAELMDHGHAKAKHDERGIQAKKMPERERLGDCEDLWRGRS